MQEEALVQGAGSKGEEIAPLHPAPCSLSSSTTENQIMAHIFNECQNYGFEILDDGIYNNNGVGSAKDVMMRCSNAQNTK